MAFAGVHVEFGYGGGRGVMAGGGQSAQSIFRLVSSENLTAAGTTTATAPVVNSNDMGEPVARIYALADAWIAFGTAPDASVEPRAFVPSGETRDYIVEAGDKVDWVVA